MEGMLLAGTEVAAGIDGSGWVCCDCARARGMTAKEANRQTSPGIRLRKRGQLIVLSVPVVEWITTSLIQERGLRVVLPGRSPRTER